MVGFYGFGFGVQELVLANALRTQLQKYPAPNSSTSRPEPLSGLGFKLEGLGFRVWGYA